jgi:hypothetical protein
MALATLWLFAVGCFSPNYGAHGDLQCDAHGECPPSFHCAADNHCYGPGINPDLAPIAVPSEDLGASDLATLADMAPVIVSVPPAAAYICGGGGGSTATSKAQLNISLGGTFATGTATAASGATLNLGYFSNDVF